LTALIRPATREDAGFIARSQIAMALETESMKLDPDTVSRGVAHVFDHPYIGFYLIGEIDGEKAGCCLVLSEWSDWRAGNVLWIHSVYIETKHRRGGVFSSLYGHLKTMVNTDPTLRGLRLYVDKSNTKAITTYQALGMNQEHYHLFEWLK